MISLKQEHLLQDLQQQEREMDTKQPRNLIHSYELVIKNKCCVDKIICYMKIIIIKINNSLDKVIIFFKASFMIQNNLN